MEELSRQASGEHTGTDEAARAERMAELRRQILELGAEYGRLRSRAAPFRPGRSVVPYAGRVFDEEEITAVLRAGLDFWLTAGPYATRLEGLLATAVGADRALLVNSGSSANLLAMATLMSPRLGSRRVRPGDEFITVAAGFPTTIAPGVQLGAVPVFVDVEARTANIDASMLEMALSPRTRAVVLAHTLGNPFDLDAVVAFCRDHDLWLIEDNCDALGAEYTSRLTGAPATRRTGTYGHLATSSFYPPHHITTGEGGAVYTSDPELASIAESLRDWGRDCWCDPGKANTCGKRFDQQFGQLPAGYDHKYVYSQFGFNLKMTDLQAAVGIPQVAKLDHFVAARRAHHAYLHERLSALEEHLVLPVATPNSNPSWFGFLMTVRPGAGATRDELVAELEAAKVQTRMLFAGNMVRQPCFDTMRERGSGYRVVGALDHSDDLMARGFWVGVYPGLTDAHLDHVCSVLEGRLGGQARHRHA